VTSPFSDAAFSNVADLTRRFLTSRFPIRPGLKAGEFARVPMTAPFIGDNGNPDKNCHIA
jgi:hypothetical protein